MISVSKTSPVLLLAFALTLMSRGTYAQNSEAELRTAARDLAAQGADAFEHQEYATALDRFGRAFSLIRAPSISIMQARSLAHLGRVLEALDKYEKTQRMPLAEDATDAFRQAVLDSRREGEELWLRVPRLTIHVRVARQTPQDLYITLDSKPVPAALLDVERPVDPGQHQIKVTAQGYETEKRTVTLEAGDHVTVDIPLNMPTPAAASSAPNRDVSGAIASDQPFRNPSRSSRPWGWAAVGVGSAGLALSAITGIVALEKKSTLDSQCHPGCPPSAADDLSTFRTTRTLSYVSLVAGSASLGLGGYILLTGSRDTAYIGASISPTQAGIKGAF
jgi:hypothetical protein